MSHSDVTYTVQARVGTAEGAWEDIATVTVPARTKRKTVIGEALTKAGIMPTPGQFPAKVRVLDVDSAAVHEIEAEQPPARWVL